MENNLRRRSAVYRNKGRSRSMMSLHDRCGEGWISYYRKNRVVPGNLGNLREIRRTRGGLAAKFFGWRWIGDPNGILALRGLHRLYWRLHPRTGLSSEE